MRSGLKLSGIAIATTFLCASAHADIAISANDTHSTLVNGVAGAATDPPPDNATVIDLSQSPPRIVGTVDVAASVLGPGQGIFVAKDESFAIISAGNRAESGKIVPDNRVSVIDLSVSPPKVVQQVTAGTGANVVAVNPAGTLALVTKVDPKQAILALRPYPIDISPDGKLLAVANAWGGNGDVGSVSLVDLSSKPFRVVDVARTPSTSEGLRFSPDGKYIATSSLNGSTSPTASPRHKDHALLTIFAVSGQTLSKTAEAPIGKWSQGVAFSANGRTIIAQNMVEKNFSVFSFADGKLTPQPPLAVPVGAPATIGTPRR
jgi:DNA-binding beta-propeller fold protein YncE